MKEKNESVIKRNSIGNHDDMISVGPNDAMKKFCACDDGLKKCPCTMTSTQDADQDHQSRE